MYVEDPLVNHGSVKAKWGVEYINSQRAVRTRVGGITLPLLIIHGTEDRLVPISASQFVMDNVGSAEKLFEVRWLIKTLIVHVAPMYAILSVEDHKTVIETLQNKICLQTTENEFL